MARVIGRETSTESISNEQYTKERNSYSINDNHNNYNNRYNNKNNRKMAIYRRNNKGEDEVMENEQPDMTDVAEGIDDDHMEEENDDDENEMNNGAKTIKYDLQVQAIFKRTPPEYATTGTVLRRGLMTWIIPVQSLQCRCPKIKLNKSYLILGKDSEAPPGYLGIGPRSIVIEWKDEWYRRMKRFQRRSRTCK